MSASIAGKYQDHYVVLGLEPSSDSETIQQAYAKLAQRYHPNNRDTGDLEKFEALNLAYEVLSDRELRAGFDKMKGVGQDENKPKFTGLEFFDGLGRDLAMRSALLCVLYDRRRTKPYKPSLSMRHIEGILDATPEELSSALWYLKQRSMVVSDDKSSLQITVDGMDFLENKRPAPKDVMALIKSTAVSGSTVRPATAPNAVPEKESPLSVLNRALAKI